MTVVSPAPHAYRADIDGLRALAVLAVVIFHAWPRALPGGFVGVDIFFVISGFLISNIILGKADRGAFSFGEFYANRVRRIFPALAVVLSTVLLAAWLTFSADEYHQLGKHTVAGVGFASNLLLYRESGYFDLLSDLKPLLHLWSLGVEEQFYLFWPPLLLWIAVRGRSQRIPFILALLTLSFAVNLWLMRGNPVGAFYLPHARVWELLIGAALAAQNLRRPGWVPRRSSDALSLVGVALIAAAVFSFTKNSAFPGWRALLPTVGAACLIAAGPSGWVNRKLLSRSFFVYVGLISYPLYLWHWPLLSFVNILGPHGLTAVDHALWNAGCVALAVVLSHLTFVWVEKPIRFGPRARRRGRAVAALCLGLIGLGILGQTIAVCGGVKSRIPGQQRAQASRTAYAEDFSARSSVECRAKFPEAEICSVSGPDRLPAIAVLGDSHATHYFEALSRHFERRGRSLIMVGNNGTPPLWNVLSQRGKLTTMDRSLEGVLQIESVQTVVLIAFWDNYFKEEGSYVGRRYIKNPIRDVQAPADIGQSAVFTRALDRTIRKILAQGKQVVFFYDIPYLSFPLSSCAPRPPLFNFKRSCEFPREEYEAANRDYRKAVHGVLAAYPQVRTFDPVDILCNATTCRVKQDDEEFLYSDDNHLSLAGARLLAEHFKF